VLLIQQVHPETAVERSVARCVKCVTTYTKKTVLATVVVNRAPNKQDTMEHIHPKDPKLDYNHIINGIYIGTNQCCTLGLSDVLKKENITADISLEELRIDQPFGVSAYLWLPTPDHTPPTKDQLVLGSMTLKTLVEQNKKVYVHCKNGHGRASTFVIAYLITQGHTLEEAESIVKKGRPTMHLQDSQKEALALFSQNWKR